MSQLYTPPELEPDFRDYEPVQPRGTDWRELGRKIWAPFAAIGAIVAKFGVAILKYKFLLGLFISFGAYLWFGGIWFAVGLIGLIFIHEMGHWLEAKRQGLPVSAPLFIPFLGASIFLKEHPENAWREFQLAIAGPLLGSAGAAVVFAIAEAEDSNKLRAIAFLGFFINLFNLLPIVPLDGGRIVTAIHPALWILGLVGLLALVIYRPNGLLVLIAATATSSGRRPRSARSSSRASRPWSGSTAPPCPSSAPRGSARATVSTRRRATSAAASRRPGSRSSPAAAPA